MVRKFPWSGASIQSPSPTIAMVHGAARGGGAGLVVRVGDFAVAHRGSTHRIAPEVRLGIGLSPGAMSLLVRKVTRADIKELLLSGEARMTLRVKHRRWDSSSEWGIWKPQPGKSISQVLQAGYRRVGKN